MAGIFGDGQRGGIFGAKVDPRLLQMALEQRAEAERQRQGQARIAGAFNAAGGMQEPSEALYAAKHQRAQEGQPQEPGFWSDLASLGPRAVGGAQKMAAAVPMAAGALWNDPLGSVNRAGLAGQAATDAVLGGMVKPFTQFGDPNVDLVKQGADLALTAMGGSAAVPAEANSLQAGLKIFSPYSKVGQDIPITETASIYVPGSGPKLIEKTFDPMTLKPGDRLVGTVGDRSHTGEDLGGIDIAGKRVMFKNPVPSEGGAGYMSHEYNPQDAFWASNQNPITLQEQRLLAHQVAAKKEGGDVYVVTQAMAAPGIDFSTQATRTALETLRRQKLTVEEREALYTALDEAMAAPRGKQFPAITDWPGMKRVMKSDRLLREMLGTHRSKLMKILDTDAMRKRGVPNMGAVRYAATAPDQRNASVLESGFGWTKLGGDVKQLSPEEVIRSHSTYPRVNTSPGMEYMGSQPMPVEVLFPGLARRVRGMDASGQQRTASMADVYEVVTPRQLERFQRWLESEKGKKLGVAGAIATGLLTAAQASALFGEEIARPTT